MLGVLVQIFGGNPVARGCGLPRKRDIALENLMRGAADSYVGAVAVEALISLRRALLLLVRPVSVKAPARALV